jgi:hypothetical protein
MNAGNSSDDDAGADDDPMEPGMPKPGDRDGGARDPVPMGGRDAMPPKGGRDAMPPKGGRDAMPPKAGRPAPPPEP